MEAYDRVREAVRSGAELSPVYLLYGDAELLKEELVRDLRRRLVPGDAAAFDYHPVPGEAPEGQADPLIEALDAAGVPPLAGERRLVVVGERGWFSSAAEERPRADEDGPPEEGPAGEGSGQGGAEPLEPAPGADRGLERLLAYLESPSPFSCLVLLSRGLDRRRRATQRALAAGNAVPCFTPEGQELVRWVVGRARGLNKSLDTEAAWCLVASVGRDLGLLAREVEKLAAYAGQSPRIDRAAVELVTPWGAQNTVFAMGDALGEGRVGRSLELLRDLLGRGQAPLRLLSIIAWHFRMLYAARTLLEEGCPPAELARRMGIKPFLARKFSRQAAALDRVRLERAMLALHQADLDIKTGRLPAPDALEVAWLRISGPEPSRSSLV
ncbi:MAG: DNA polymerase III subunit delta [Acetobacteraceae bacterium]|nr:DNA polymerase III subunit delta [Acetobacteraceae bacterium]